MVGGSKACGNACIPHSTLFSNTPSPACTRRIKRHELVMRKRRTNTTSMLIRSKEREREYLTCKVNISFGVPVQVKTTHLIVVLVLALLLLLLLIGSYIPACLVGELRFLAPLLQPCSRTESRCPDAAAVPVERNFLICPFNLYHNHNHSVLSSCFNFSGCLPLDAIPGGGLAFLFYLPFHCYLFGLAFVITRPDPCWLLPRSCHVTQPTLS
jgi:hypothetical protein